VPRKPALGSAVVQQADILQEMWRQFRGVLGRAACQQATEFHAGMKASHHPKQPPGDALAPIASGKRAQCFACHSLKLVGHLGSPFLTVKKDIVVRLTSAVRDNRVEEFSCERADFSPS
jgi:hypothetical protein